MRILFVEVKSYKEGRKGLKGRKGLFSIVLWVLFVVYVLLIRTISSRNGFCNFPTTDWNSFRNTSYLSIVFSPEPLT